MAPLCHIILGDLSRDIIVCKVLWYLVVQISRLEGLVFLVSKRNNKNFWFGFSQKYFLICSLETSDRALEKTIKMKFKYIQIPLMRDHKMFVKWMMALAPGSLPCEASSAQSPATLQPPKHPSLTLIARNGHPSDHFYLTDTIRA